MDIKLIEKLINLVDKSCVNEIAVETSDLKVKITKNAEQIIKEVAPQVYSLPQVQPQTVSQVQQTTSQITQTTETKENKPSKNLIEIKSPMVGTLYSAPSPDSAPYVKVGDKISVGQVLCIIEAMKLMNEIESETSGTIVEICVQNAQSVEYGIVLFKVEPN
ncbi:acetyl-CoA carboxylase biotin carboxyl carrier protein [bacterium]|nr:acetyl-CoA carboxylase biotin carboxyl carrier protein [bacterium]